MDHHHQGPSEKSVRQEERRSPEQTANWLSLATFHWTSNLLWRGFRNPLESADIPLLHSKYHAADITVQVQNDFRTRCAAGHKNPLWAALFSAFKTEFYIGGVCRGTADCLLVMVPFLSRYLIQFTIDSYIAHVTDQQGPPVRVGIGYLAGIVAMLITQSLAHNHYMYMFSVIGGRTRAILSSAIFEKSGNLHGRARQDPNASEESSLEERSSKKKAKKAPSDDQAHTAGHIINLISVDCSRIAQTVSAIHMLWTCPLACSLAIALLVYNLRESALAGLGLLLLGFFGLIFVVANLFRMRKAIDVITRERVSLLQETLSGIRLLKLFAWESGIASRIDAIRSRETHSQYRYGAVRTFAGAVSQALPVMTAMITFITYALTDNILSPAVVFSSTSLFTSLRMPLIYLPMCVQACIDCWASLQRVERFLLMGEHAVYPIDLELKATAEIRDATFSWDGSVSVGEKSKSEDELSAASSSDGKRSRDGFALRDVNLTLHRGELMAVVGSVGSGKTSLLSALVGNMEMSSGTVTWGTSYVICPQQPWILNATVRENITFGTEWDAKRYETVVHASSLARDFLLLPHGDHTVVGERGAVLSGGQKQRITLARAMYSHTDCVLLDDPLSAVDANVSRALLDEGICGFMQRRTRLLCTHDTKVLQRCDRVLWMENGHIRKLDTYHNLMTTDPDFALFVHGGQDTETADSTTAVKPIEANPQRSSAALDSEDDLLEKDTSAQDEDRTTKSVSWAVYGALISPKMSAFLFAACPPFLMIGNGSTIITQLWLSWWSSDRYQLPRNTYIAIYVSLAVAQLLFLYLFGFMLNLACANSTRIMFNRAVRRLLNAPVGFFDRTPLGRHMNRLTADVDKMDNALPETLRMFLISLTALIPIFVIQIVYYNWFGIAVAVLVIALLTLAVYYRSTARETERLESVFRSMVLARIVEGLSGSSTLRAYGMYASFTSKLHDSLDLMNSAAFSTVAVQRWLSLRQDAVTVLALIVLGALILVERNNQNPAISGVSLSLMINAIQVIQVVVREWAEVETAMNSTERLHAYANVIPQEEDTDEDPSSRPPSPPPGDHQWPSSGAITFAGISMKYRPDLPQSLQDINLEIHSGEHIAIVGRTGAGKSSIVNAVFRFVPLSQGHIHIDGRDISKLSLHTLRSALAIIPQDTTLFSGTVRSNLDPFQCHSDLELQRALDQAHLSHRLRLSDPLQPDGSNLSVGQRQLLALARVLLRHSRILICDEATSSLDTETDELIQVTMKRRFEGRTVICIAHRLRSVLWYDRVVVLDEGRVKEVGSPRQLWGLVGGIFRGMCEKAGVTGEMVEAAAKVEEEGRAGRVDLEETLGLEL